MPAAAPSKCLILPWQAGEFTNSIEERRTSCAANRIASRNPHKPIGPRLDRMGSRGEPAEPRRVRHQAEPHAEGCIHGHDLLARDRRQERGPQGAPGQGRHGRRARCYATSAEPRVRIHLPPAESLQTFGSFPRHGPIARHNGQQASRSLSHHASHSRARLRP